MPHSTWNNRFTGRSVWWTSYLTSTGQQDRANYLLYIIFFKVVLSHCFVQRWSIWNPTSRELLSGSVPNTWKNSGKLHYQTEVVAKFIYCLSFLRNKCRKFIYWITRKLISLCRINCVLFHFKILLLYINTICIIIYKIDEENEFSSLNLWIAKK